MDTIFNPVPPSISINVPSFFEGADPLLVKIVDSGSCETFQLVTCEDVNPAICLTLFSDGNDGKVYIYDVFTNTSTFAPLDPTFISNDIAHTEDKLWLLSGTSAIAEWNISLNPIFTATFNRFVSYPSGYTPSNGLAAKDDTTLVVVNQSGTSPYYVAEMDISGSVGVLTNKFLLNPNRRVTGDFFVTTNNKFIVTLTSTVPPIANFIAQYDYQTGLFEVEIQLPFSQSFGIFEDNGSIFVGRLNGDIYQILNQNPYTISYVVNAERFIAGSSQVPSCLNISFI